MIQFKKKPCTNKNKLMYWQYSHAKGMHVKRTNLVSFIMQYGNILISIR